MFKSKNILWFSRSLPIKALGSAPPTTKNTSRQFKYIINLWIHRLIKFNESPYRIAMGCACGIFCSALPIFGQTFISMIAARLLRASIIASIPWTWISNPLTTLPMWYGGYRLGIWLMPGKHKPLSYDEIQALMQNFDQMHWTQSLSLLSAELWDALQPLWLGSVIMGLAMAAPSFILLYYLTRGILLRRARRLQKNN
jgi:uncharacterized protein (DUF2062 family)